MRAIPDPQPGTRFNRWTVMSPADSIRGSRASKCVCDCGSVRVLSTRSLRTGKSKSCGCLANELSALRTAKRIKHGMGGTPEYKTWISIKTRCLNTGARDYAKYGAKGITMCDRWVASFDDFYADMGERPSVDHSIDRIDGNKGYSPENCRWATHEMQNNNRRINVRIQFDGREQTLTQWARELGITVSKTYYWMGLGYAPEKIFRNEL